MVQKTVAVLRGGVGAEHTVSLQSGATVLKELLGPLHDRFHSRDIFIDRSGVWYVRGVPTAPERALRGVDVVWNALHGEYGEDGTVQRILERVGIPYTGSRPYASALSMNKQATKRAVEKAGIKVPYSITLSVSDSLDQEILHAFRNFPMPSVVKPGNSGSSYGVTLARDFFTFQEAVRHAFSFSPLVIIEEYVRGKEATVGVVDRLRNETLYRLPPVEIVVPSGVGIFSYEAKYEIPALEKCPGSFSSDESRTLQEVAEVVHKTLGLRHYSRSDCIVTPQGVYFLEVNALPGLTENSLLPKALQAVGISTPEFIEHVLNLAEARG